MKLKSKTKERLELECIDLLGMTPDEAIDFVEEFPKTAIWSVQNAKVESKKKKYKKPYGTEKKTRQANLFGSTP